MVELDSPILSDRVPGGRFRLKLETFQHTGTFKARGALSTVRAIPAAKALAGITAASAGNHAIAAAWAARQRGLSAKMVMYAGANPLRIALTKAQGAEVVLKEDMAAVFAEAERLVRDEGRTFVHPFEGENISLATGGIGLEFLEAAPDLDAVVVAVGGGGLISGVAAAIKQIKPTCAVYGVEPEGAAAMSGSLAAGRPVTLDRVASIADSLAPPMALPFSFNIVRHYVDDIVQVSDDAMREGMMILQQDAKLAVEPAPGAVIAAVLGPLAERLSGKTVGLVICGANIDTQSYLNLLDGKT